MSVPDLQSKARDDVDAIVRLRGHPPRVVRLSRKAIAILCAASLALVTGGLIIALRPPPPKESEGHVATGGIALADRVAAAPSDYAQVPRLGPPLPGDLGKPILDAQDRGALAELPPVGASAAPAAASPPDPDELQRERFRQEREAARASQLFFSGAANPGTIATDLAKSSVPSGRIDGTGASSRQPGFLERPVDHRTASIERLGARANDRSLLTGSVIPAALITGIRSDQPGLVTAHVTENVFDSLTGRRLLVPQGSRLIGDYATDVGFGQRRVLLAWNRLILPDGRSITLERQPAADPSGYAGLEDRVDFHWDGVIKAALVSTLLEVGDGLGSETEDAFVRALRRGSQQSIARAGDQVVSRALDNRPTLTIRPGYRLRVLVTRDLELGNGL